MRENAASAHNSQAPQAVSAHIQDARRMLQIVIVSGARHELEYAGQVLSGNHAANDAVVHLGVAQSNALLQNPPGGDD